MDYPQALPLTSCVTISCLLNLSVPAILIPRADHYRAFLPRFAEAMEEDIMCWSSNQPQQTSSLIVLFLFYIRDGQNFTRHLSPDGGPWDRGCQSWLVCGMTRELSNTPAQAARSEILVQMVQGVAGAPGAPRLAG